MRYEMTLIEHTMYTVFTSNFPLFIIIIDVDIRNSCHSEIKGAFCHGSSRCRHLYSCLSVRRFRAWRADSLARARLDDVVCGRADCRDRRGARDSVDARARQRGIVKIVDNFASNLSSAID